MKRHKLLLALIAAAVVAFGAAGPAAAETYDYDFGTLLSPIPGFQPDSTFAHLAVSTTDHLTYTFTLSTGNLNTIFGNGTFISKAVFNTVSGQDPNSTVRLGGDVANVKSIANAAHPGAVGFDFGDCFGSGSSCSHSNTSTGRLTASEQITWIAMFSGSTTVSLQPDPFFSTPPVALHLQGFNQSLLGGGLRDDDNREENGGVFVTSGWYTPTITVAIPEPETYAMMLAGLGLLGFVARRRKQKEAA